MVFQKEGHGAADGANEDQDGGDFSDYSALGIYFHL